MPRVEALPNPAVYGPLQTRFDSNGTNTFEQAGTIPDVRLQLKQINIIPNISHMPNPSSDVDLRTAGDFLRITRELDELGCIGQGRQYINREDEKGIVGRVAQQKVTQIRELLHPQDEKGEVLPVSDFQYFLRETPFVNEMLSAAPPKGQAII